MTRVSIVCLVLCTLPPLCGATGVDEQARSVCRWIESEEAIPTTMLEQAVAMDAEERRAEGISGECAVVLECLLAARPGKKNAGDSGPVDPESLCWRVVEIEKLSKETIDRMLEQVDPEEKSCRRFLGCLSRSGAGVHSDPSWREDFARICSFTDVSDTLSREELQALVDDCEKLLAVLEKLPEREGKVYIFRLKMCRDLFAYSLQLLEADSADRD